MIDLFIKQTIKQTNKQTNTNQMYIDWPFWSSTSYFLPTTPMSLTDKSAPKQDLPPY